MTSPFGERLAEACERVKAPVVVGLDPHLGRLPRPLRRTYEGLTGPDHRVAAARAVRLFNSVVIEAIQGLVPAIKPQLAFYEALGAPGWAALEETCIRARQAGLLVIADGKRGDISSTARAYAQAILAPDGPLAADALTVNPWMGLDTIDPYLPLVREHGRGLFLLVRTTNPGSGELQLHGEPRAAWRVAEGIRERNATLCAELGGSLGPLGAVVGALSPEDAGSLRAAMPRSWFLVPGVGAQGGSMADAVAGARGDGLGAAVTSSRAVIFGPECELEHCTMADLGAAVGRRAHRLVEGVREALDSRA